MSDEGKLTPEAKWYVVHTYSGHENKVKDTLELIIENRGLEEMIQEVLVPTENVIEVKDGKRRTIERKIYPSYVLIKMILTDEIWYIVRNTRCNGFVGPSSTNPVPLTEEELMMIGLESSWEPVDYEVGDTVRLSMVHLKVSTARLKKLTREEKVTVMVSCSAGNTGRARLDQVIAYRD